MDRKVVETLITRPELRRAVKAAVHFNAIFEPNLLRNRLKEGLLLLKAHQPIAKLLECEFHAFAGLCAGATVRYLEAVLE